MSQAVTNDLDVRLLAPRDKHATIFARLLELTPGDALRIFNDHDPKPLQYQLQAEHAGEFSWEPEQQGPEEWIIRIRRVISAA
ncbi:hypothetical protein KDA_54020 [Dictyobacter alpinus]|uniref:DUF2249 domain-containing protein n=1 Tax=Dictyobacter alpinus TaxID=2014873 RepID=A0A402BEV2_9CHLR|nr:DUF2249 domain-containing protein [Dictyobacter alpinus]GCE29918.1 hypothetical protein KDA_54020 [Dictyobacter alpinus]